MDVTLSEVSWIAAGFSLGVVSTLGFWKVPVALRTVKYSSKALLKKPKFVIVARTVGMGRGKIASQCAHAAVSCYREASLNQPEIVKTWEAFGQPKIVLRVEDTDDKILLLADKAKELGLVTNVIRDAGRTQVSPGSITVIGIGPGDSDTIDSVTGHLKLL